ncbi:MAG TPA: hypothetical protein VEW03_16470, partial [Longimicrobiaceae bacterium]|nr:hypothetical protein [Longimicrobiaceae bacterium]
QPLGRAVGNALEVREAVETLTGAGPRDLWALTLELGAHLLVMSGLAADADAARATLTRLRDSGAGARKLEELIEAQGGDPRVVGDPDLLPAAPVVRPVDSGAAGPRWVAEADARRIAEAALALGAGRVRKDAPIDPAVGVVMAAGIGDRVEAGQPVAFIHARSADQAAAAEAALRRALRFAPGPTVTPGDDYEVVGE